MLNGKPESQAEKDAMDLDRLRSNNCRLNDLNTALTHENNRLLAKVGTLEKREREHSALRAQHRALKWEVESLESKVPSVGDINLFVSWLRKAEADLRRASVLAHLQKDSEDDRRFNNLAEWMRRTASEWEGHARRWREAIAHLKSMP